MAATKGEKLVALEMLATVGLVTIKELRAGSMPGPSQYVGAVVAFLFLAGLAAYGPTADLAAAFGGLVLLAILLRPYSKGTTGKGAPTITASDLTGALNRFTNYVASQPATTAQGSTIQ